MAANLPECNYLSSDKSETTKEFAIKFIEKNNIKFKAIKSTSFEKNWKLKKNKINAAIISIPLDKIAIFKLNILKKLSNHDPLYNPNPFALKEANSPSIKNWKDRKNIIRSVSVNSVSCKIVKFFL